MRDCFLLLAIGMHVLLHAQEPATPLHAPEPAAPSPTVLKAESSLPIGIASFSFQGQPVCDAAGNMYFDAGVIPGRLGPYLEIEHDGLKHVNFSLPYDESDWGAVVDAVSPGGTFYVLHTGVKKHAFVLIRYGSDGVAVEKTEIAIP